MGARDILTRLCTARQTVIQTACYSMAGGISFAVPAIQDEIDLLPQPGGPWSAPAENPFVSDRDIRIVMDDDLGYPAYSEGGAWISSAQPDFLRFGSRVLQGEAPGSTAVFSCAVPRTRFQTLASVVTLTSVASAVALIALTFWIEGPI